MTVPTPVPGELLQSAFRSLSHPRLSLLVESAPLPDVPSLYGVYAVSHTWFRLGLDAPSGELPLYVGKHEARDQGHSLESHFRAGRTAHSTLRRSFAALLREELVLRGIPRDPSAPDRPSHYGMSPEHDAKLDAWMRDHLEITVWEKPRECSELGAVEAAVITRWTPPLCLKPGTTTWRPMLTRARNRMISDVREWAETRGLPIKP